jgi:mRNA interferase MazF
MRRGDICWVDLGEPKGSQPGYRRPIIIVQDDEFNNSKLATVIVLSLTTNLNLRKMPGCVYLASSESGLPSDSIVNCSQIRTIDKSLIDEHVGQVDDSVMFMIDNALRRVLGLG